MKKVSLFIFTTAAAWAAVCFFKVFQASDPSGGDGYFYLKQIEWLADQHQFYHADYSLIFLPLAVLYKLTGSSLLAFQIVTSISLFLISSSVGFVFYRSLLDKKNETSKMPLWKATLLCCFFTLVFSMQASVLKLSFEFAKSGFAKGILLCGIASYYFDRRKLGFGLLLIAALTHKIAAIFFVVAGCSFLVDWFFKTENRRSRNLLGIFFGFAGLFFFASIIILFPRMALHFQSFLNHLTFEKFVLGQLENQLVGRFLILITALWLLTGLIQFRKMKSSALGATLLFSIVPFLPVFGGYNIEIKYRLLLMSFTFSAIGFVMTWPTIKNNYLQRLIMMITLTVLSFQAFQYSGFPWIMKWSERIKNLDQLQERVSPKDELVTQHGLQFYIDYKTRIRARSMISAERAPVYQIAYTPEFYHLNPTLSDELKQIEIISLGDSFSLFEYEEFQNLMKEYPMLADWRNQFQVRPSFVQDYK